MNETFYSRSIVYLEQISYSSLTCFFTLNFEHSHIKFISLPLFLKLLLSLFNLPIVFYFQYILLPLFLLFPNSNLSLQHIYRLLMNFTNSFLFSLLICFNQIFPFPFTPDIQLKNIMKVLLAYNC